MAIATRSGAYTTVGPSSFSGGLFASQTPYSQSYAISDPDVQKQLAVQMRAQDMQQGRFNALLAALQGQFGSTPNRIGGKTGKPPPIHVGGVYDPQQVQQQVNMSKANIDQQTATNVQNAMERVGGSGMGAQSPLAQALSGQLQSAGLQSRVGSETDIRNKAAQMNAGQLLNTQQALSNQWAQKQQFDIERLRPYWQLYGQRMGALASLMS